MQMKYLPRSERRKIGLIAGSGPEAGVDLWNKIVEEAKKLLGDEYIGDLDGPTVRIISAPILGLSMELEHNDIAVWPELERHFNDLASQTDLIAIACNTLNYYERQIKCVPREAEFVSVCDVVAEYLAENGHSTVALLGAAPVTKMDAWSAYRRLADDFAVELPNNPITLHEIIYDVKRFGGNEPSLAARFNEIIAELKADTVLLACTELPLIQASATKKELLDVTRLLARKLVHKAFLKANC